MKTFLNKDLKNNSMKMETFNVELTGKTANYMDFVNYSIKMKMETLNVELTMKTVTYDFLKISMKMETFNVELTMKTVKRSFMKNSIKTEKQKKLTNM
jgi:hypothetical protein